MSLIFEKYTGMGNDYLIYDTLKNNHVLTTQDIRWICNRNFGVGSDGILVGPFMQKDTISLQIYNPDGSTTENSGNGVMIFAKYMLDAGYVTKTDFVLNTQGGEVTVHYESDDNNRIRVSMGRISFMSDDVGMLGDRREVVDEPLIFGDKEYLCTCASVGNPHCVIPMPYISKDMICEIGKYAETAEYFPKRINTEIVKVTDRNHIAIEIFERGAGYTLSSGSSACAAVATCLRAGVVDREVEVTMPGGELIVEIDEQEEIYLTGTVSKICKILIPNQEAMTA